MPRPPQTAFVGRQRVYDRYVSEMKGPAGYRDDAAAYEAQAAATAHRVRGWLPTDVNAPILELGCGPGHFLLLCERAGYTDVTGVDISAEQVKRARAVCRTATVVEGDLFDALDGKAGHYSLVVALDVIEHFTRDEALALLERVARALRPRGRVILQTPNAESPRGLAIRYGDVTHETMYTPGSLEHVLRMTGFEGFEARESRPFVHGMPSAARWVLWQAIRTGLMFWNLAETGSAGSGCYTRVMMASARTPGNGR